MLESCFADTFYFIALLNPKDSYRAAAHEFAAAFAGRLVTTEGIILELLDACHHPNLRGSAAAFVTQLREREDVLIVGLDPVLLKAGFDLYRDRLDKYWSLTDCISFVVMTREGIADALTADRQFEQAGFNALFRRDEP